MQPALCAKRRSWRKHGVLIGWTNTPGVFFFFFNDTATTEIYTLSLHDALPTPALMPQRTHAWRAIIIERVIDLKGLGFGHRDHK